MANCAKLPDVRERKGSTCLWSYALALVIAAMRCAAAAEREQAMLDAERTATEAVFLRGDIDYLPMARTMAYAVRLAISLCGDTDYHPMISTDASDYHPMTCSGLSSYDMRQDISLRGPGSRRHAAHPRLQRTRSPGRLCPMRCAVLSSAMLLPLPYAMCGTDVGYFRRCAVLARLCCYPSPMHAAHPRLQRTRSPGCLPLSAYAPPMRCPVLTQRMVGICLCDVRY
eukprot:2406455-Rhodomonas_salina.3